MRGGLVFTRTAKKRLTSRPASYIIPEYIELMWLAFQPPLISKKLTGTGGEIK